jgi:predicted kinase
VQLALDLDSNLIVVECECKLKTIQSRLKARENHTGLSDARIQHLPEIISHFEPITELDRDIHIKVKTDISIENTFHEILSNAYLCKSAQIKTRI